MNIDAELLAEIKVRASRAHRSIGDVMEDALRDYLARGEAERAVVVLPDFDYRGGITVDLYDKDALDELMRDDAVS